MRFTDMRRKFSPREDKRSTGITNGRRKDGPEGEKAAFRAAF